MGPLDGCPLAGGSGGGDGGTAQYEAAMRVLGPICWYTLAHLAQPPGMVS